MRISLERIIQDLRESEENVEKYLAAQRLANVGNIVEGIAHKFNNILGGILGYSQLLQDELPKDSGGYEKAAIIEGAAKRASSLILQLHLFANQKQSFAKKPIDPKVMVNEVTAIARDTFNSNITITANLDHGPHHIMADLQSMKLALLNLFLNSRDAMPSGGDLTLNTRFVAGKDAKVKPPSNQSRGLVVFEIADTGTGIGPTDLARAFEPFFTTKKNKTASGLGLTRAREIIEAHDGKIELQSEYGQGTSVLVSVPAMQRLRRVAKKVQEVGPGRAKGEVIMVVDDEKELRDMAKIIFEQKGFQVLLADSGESAIKIFGENSEHINLVILDMVLPGPNGGQVYEIIKREASKPKIILTSGYSKDSANLDFLEKENELFVPKPWDLPELIESVSQLLDSDE